MSLKPHTAPLPEEDILLRITPRQLAMLLGEIVSLMLVSKLHRLYQVRDVADIMLPAINRNQYRIYRDADKRPVAFVTWGWLSDEVVTGYHAGKHVLSEAELSSGDTLYFMDFIAPYGHARRVIRDLRTQVFPDAIGYSLRFMEQGKSRPRPYLFRGVNRRGG